MTTKKQPTAKEACTYLTKAVLSFLLFLLTIYILLNPINILLNYLLHVTISYGFLYASSIVLSILITKPQIPSKDTTVKEDLERVDYFLKFNCVKVVASLVVWGIVKYFFT